MGNSILNYNRDFILVWERPEQSTGEENIKKILLQFIYTTGSRYYAVHQNSGEFNRRALKSVGQKMSLVTHSCGHTRMASSMGNVLEFIVSTSKNWSVSTGCARSNA